MSPFRARLYLFRFVNACILILPLYVAMFVDVGLTPAQITVALSAWSVAVFVLQAPMGALADRWSRRYVLAFGQVAFAACFLAWWAWPGFWGIFAGLLLWGVKSASTQGVFEALVYDELKARGEAETYLQVLGRARAVDALGNLAAALGAAALTRFGYQPAILASIAAAVIGVGAALALPPAPPALALATGGYWDRLRGGVAEVARRPAVLAVIGFAALISTLGPGLQEFWPVYGRAVGLTLPVISLFVGVQFALEAAANASAHRLRNLPSTWFYTGLGALGLTLLAAAAIWRAPAIALLAIYSGGFRLIEVNFEGRLQALIPSERRATIGAVKGLVTQIGMISLFAGIGAAAQAGSYRIAFIAVGAVGVIAASGWLLAGAMRRTPTP
jgi:MFS family permease